MKRWRRIRPERSALSSPRLFAGLPLSSAAILDVEIGCEVLMLQCLPPLGMRKAWQRCETGLTAFWDMWCVPRGCKGSEGGCPQWTSFSPRQKLRKWGGRYWSKKVPAAWKKKALQCVRGGEDEQNFYFWESIFFLNGLTIESLKTDPSHLNNA